MVSILTSKNYREVTSGESIGGGSRGSITSDLSYRLGERGRRREEREEKIWKRQRGEEEQAVKEPVLEGHGSCRDSHAK